MKIGVFAAGGTGGFFGALLARGGNEVHFIARGAHLEAIRSGGLRVNSKSAGQFTVQAVVTDKPSEVGPCDLVLFSVKGPDLAAGALAIAPMMGPNTLVLPILNGLGAPYLLREHYGSRALGGSCAIESFIAEPGLITNLSRGAILTFGELDGGITPRTEVIHDVMKAADMQVSLTPDMLQALWIKLLSLAPMSAFTTLLQVPMGSIQGQPETLSLMDRMVTEVWSLGRAEGANLTAEHLAAAHERLRKVSSAMKSSMQRDREKGRPLEVELIQGDIVRRARGREMAVPVTEALYGLLKVHADG